MVIRLTTKVALSAALLIAAACGQKSASEPNQTAGAGAAAPDAGPTDAGEEKPAEPPPPPPAQILRVIVLSAEVEGRMQNGEDWDKKEASVLDGVPKPILAYLEQHPELKETATLLGTPIEAEKLEKAAKKSPAADPMVIVEVGNRTFRSTAQPREFNPVWEFPFEILFRDAGERRGIPPGTVARFHVVDFDGAAAYDMIGSTLITIDDLAAKPVHQIGPFGSVKKLTVQVEARLAPGPDTQPSTHRIAVPGNARWTDTGLDLVAGQRVTIDAADEVCSKGGSLSHCSGPEGQRKTSSYNLRGFEKIGHAALVAALGDTRFPVKRGLKLMVPASGRLRLGINDKDTKDNRGSYAVRITVEPLP
jgi:hypothetical protein